MKLYLTKAALSEPPPLPPGKAKLVLHDTKLPGFVAEVRASGVTFYCKYKTRARQTRMVKIGRLGQDVTVDQARKRAIGLRGRVAAGEDPAAVRQQQTRAMTVRTFVETEFLPHQKARKRSWQEDVKLLEKRILPALGNKLLGDVTTAEIARLHDGIVAAGRKPGTANRHLALVKTMFAKARLWGHIERSPADGVRLFKENGARQRFLSQEEIRRLVAALGEDSDQVGANLLLFLLLTGARFGEAASARWELVDVERRLWVVPRTKGGKVAHKQLSTAALRLVSSLAREDGSPFLFPGHLADSYRRDVRHTWRRVCKRAGITDCRVHDLRHTYASLLINSGASLYVVQKLLGHATPTMTARYSHLSASTLADANEAAAQLIFGEGNSLTGTAIDHG